MATKLVKSREEEEEELLREENNRRTDEALQKVSAQREKSSERDATEERRRRALESIHRMEWLKNQDDIAASLRTRRIRTQGVLIPVVKREEEDYFSGTGKGAKVRSRKREKEETIKSLHDFSTTAELPPPPPRNAPPAPPPVSAWAVKPGAALFRGTSAALRITYGIKNYDEELMLGQALQESMMEQELYQDSSYVEDQRYNGQRDSAHNNYQCYKESSRNSHYDDSRVRHEKSLSGDENDDTDYYQKGIEMAQARARERAAAREAAEAEKKRAAEAQKEREEARRAAEEARRAAEEEREEARRALEKEREEARRAAEREQEEARRAADREIEAARRAAEREREQERLARAAEREREQERLARAAEEAERAAAEERKTMAYPPKIDPDMMQSQRPRSTLNSPRSSSPNVNPEIPTEVQAQFALETELPPVKPEAPEDQRQMWSRAEVPAAPPRFTEVPPIYPNTNPPDEGIRGYEPKKVAEDPNRMYTPEELIFFECKTEVPANPPDPPESAPVGNPYQYNLSYGAYTGMAQAIPDKNAPYNYPTNPDLFYPSGKPREGADPNGPLLQAFQGLQLGGLSNIDPQILQMTLMMNQYVSSQLGGLSLENALLAALSQLPRVPPSSANEAAPAVPALPPRPRCPPPEPASPGTTPLSLSDIYSPTPNHHAFSAFPVKGNFIRAPAPGHGEAS